MQKSACMVWGKFTAEMNKQFSGKIKNILSEGMFFVYVKYLKLNKKIFREILQTLKLYILIY